jgi:hypothetical protein
VIVSAIAGILIYVISERARGGKSDVQLIDEVAAEVGAGAPAGGSAPAGGGSAPAGGGSAPAGGGDLGGGTAPAS